MTQTLLLVVITATLSSITTMYAPTLVARLKRVFTWKKRSKTYKWGKHKLTLEQVLEQIEKRIDLLNTQNLSFHDRVDQVESYARKRDSDRTSKTKKIVVDYLKELQK